MDLFRLAAPFYDGLMKVAGHQKTIKKAVEQVRIKPDDVICDIGAGTGQLSRLLPAENKLILVDSSDRMLKKARKKVANQAKIVISRAQNLSLEDNSCDLVFCIDALHHFERTGSALAEMKRIVRNDGAIVILEFDPANLKTRIMQWLEELAGEPGCFYSPDKLAAFFKKFGCNTEIVKLSSWQYVLLASDDLTGRRGIDGF